MSKKEKKDKVKTAKPFLKWVGGKSQLLATFQKLYPKELKKESLLHYCEPFLGGGAVFFDIAQQFNLKSAKLFDINRELVLTYKVVQKDVDLLMEFLERYSSEYLSLSIDRQKEYYYEFRTNYNHQRFQIDYKRYNENWIPRAAQLIFLNKTCFNGLYRVNQKGEFNTPSGVYKKQHNPKILNETNLKATSKILSIADIEVSSFSKIENEIKKTSFIYFDPPYRPISKTASFTNYSEKNFGDPLQLELAQVFENLDKKGNFVMLSNSDPKNENKEDSFFDDLYKNYDIKRVAANRVINSKVSKRGKISEIVVRNY